MLLDGCADIVCSSLTKLFSGVGNVMAGSIVLQNKLHDHARKAALIRNSSDDNINTQPLLSHLLRCMDIEGDLVGLNEQDAVVLETNSRDFLHRSSMINERAMKLACYLRDHEAIMELYYPGCGKIGGEINEGKPTKNLCFIKKIVWQY